MATYSEIQIWVKSKYGFVPKTCWIAHAKEICGLEPSLAPNRLSPDIRENPCPTEKLSAIRKAFEHFGMI